MKVLTFLKQKRKRIFYFLVGIFSFLFTILNCFSSVEASEEDYKSYSTIYGQFKTDGYNSHGAFIYKNSESLLNQYLLAFQNNYMDSGVNWIFKDSAFNLSNIQGGSYSLLSYDIVSDHNNLNDFCIVSYQWDGRQGFRIYSKYDFNIKVSSFSCDALPDFTNNPYEANVSTYDSINQLYYYQFFYWSIPEGSMASCYILNSPSSHESDLVETALDFFNDNDMSKVLNSDFVNYINSSANQSFYDNDNYYNGYLKNFSVNWSPLVPEVTSVNEVNEIVFEDQKIVLTYDPVKTQANKINEFSINAKYTYGLQLKFYGYNMDTLNAFINSPDFPNRYLGTVNGQELATLEPIACKNYQKALENYIRSLNNAGFIVIESNRTWQYVEYTARFNFSITRVHPVSISGTNFIFVKDLFNTYQLNILNLVSNNSMGVASFDQTDANYSSLGTGYDFALTIKQIDALGDKTLPINITIPDVGEVNVLDINLNGFSAANELIGNVDVVYNDLQCEYTMNTNKDSKMVYKFDFVSGSGSIVSDTISSKPANNPSINKDNQVINNKDTDLSFSGGGSGVSGGSGGSSSSSSNSSGGNASATSNSGGNTQNVTVQNGLNWSDKPIYGQNITVGSSINTGLNTITSMMSTNSFVPIISTWFSFIPQPFWNLITTVFTICILLLVFKFFLWII